VTQVAKRAGSLAWSRRRILALLSAIAVIRPARADDAIVEMSKLKFAPAEIEIPVGGTVTFVNLDLVPHTATGDAFDTGTLRKDERKAVAFPAAGEFPYLCKFHRHMTGRIVVR
jgi:plastocyanin